MVRNTAFDGQLMNCGPENFTTSQQQPAPEHPAAAAPVPIVLRSNVTINLNSDRILRGIIGRGSMMRQLQGHVPNHRQPRAASPNEFEDEDQAFVDVVAELEP
ncbi:unnamed protein product [Brachionus calyciflorus]|uniref:Uncharacterized protein n=1 Tax=Brachionus calyciflorus TaxID=104777 RepID=A0A813RYE4_9BILA|nr:unnamed protein product [Brachionus calyciflorus]